ncbi:YggT family protein [Candidatus Poribacteria bacterium]|nr:YggT family protein [Candidatus Poribacteria bacterium]
MSGPVIYLLSKVIWLYTIIVFVNAILSWFVHSSRNMTLRQIYWITNQLVNPVLDPIRRVLYPMTRNFGIDISPIILILLLQVLEQILFSALR